MKYEIEFIHKIQDGVSRNIVLTFGEHDIKGIAQKCFEYGSSGIWREVKVKKLPDNMAMADKSGMEFADMPTLDYGA